MITTPKGAEALGLILPNPEYVNIWLSGNPQPEKEAEIERIARQAEAEREADEAISHGRDNNRIRRLITSRHLKRSHKNTPTHAE